MGRRGPEGGGERLSMQKADVTSFKVEKNDVVAAKTLKEGKTILTGPKGERGYYTRMDLDNLGELADNPAAIRELILDEFGDQTDTREIMKELSHCLVQARHFLMDYLRIDLGGEIENIPSDEEKKWHWSTVNEIMKKTTSARGGARGLSPYYCALVKTIYAELRYNRGNMSGFNEESRYLYQSLFRPSKADRHIHFYTPHADQSKEVEEVDTMDVMVSDSRWLHVKGGYRGKSRDSTIAKLIVKPEAKAESIKDMIGLRFEVGDEKEATDLIICLIKHLEANYEIKNTSVFGLGLLPPKEEDRIFSEFNPEGEEEARIAYGLGRSATSNPRYRDLKIMTKIKLPPNGNDKVPVEDWEERSLEIQIILDKDKNENNKGFASHLVYKRAQKLLAYARLFKSVSLDYVKQVAGEASVLTGISADKIERYFIDNFLEKRPVKGKTKYFAENQLDRLERIGRLPKEIPPARRKIIK